MSRQRERVCLNDGLKLDLNRMAELGTVRRGAMTGQRGIAWTNLYWGEIAAGTIAADMSGELGGWFRVHIDGTRPRAANPITRRLPGALGR